MIRQEEHQGAVEANFSGARREGSRIIVTYYDQGTKEVVFDLDKRQITKGATVIQMSGITRCDIDYYIHQGDMKESQMFCLLISDGKRELKLSDRVKEYYGVNDPDMELSKHCLISCLSGSSPPQRQEQRSFIKKRKSISSGKDRMTMADRAHRKELLAQFKQSHPEAGVYRLVNSRNNKSLLGSSSNLQSIRNRLEFARSTKMPGALDRRLDRDIREHGIEAFSMEVLDMLDIKPEMTADDIKRDLATLEALWREKMDPSLLY